MFSAVKIRLQTIEVFSIILCICLNLFCSEKPKISDEEKEAFINTYVGLSLAYTKYNKFPKQYHQAVDNIYAQNGTSEELLNNFMEKISSYPETQYEIFQTIASQLEIYENLPADSLARFLKNMLNQP
jgi:hypothetical protein